MFPLTHIYCTKRIVEKANSLLLYGSIFPDIPVTGIISWQRMMDETERFSSYIKKTNPDLTEFAGGLLFHEEPKGIDRFSHGKNGFAYTKGKEILNYVKKYFAEDSLRVSHSFIEFAVELLLVGDIPNLQNQIRPVLKLANQKLNQIAEVFSGFFNLDIKKTKKSIREFNHFLSGMDLSSRRKSISFCTHLINRMEKTNFSTDIIGILLEKAIDSVRGDYQNFLQDAIRMCKDKVQTRRFA